MTDPNALAAKAWEDACHGTDAENIAAIAAVYAPLVESLSNDGELLTIAWMDGAHHSNTAHRARIAELEAEVERLREALEEIMGLPGEINPSNYDHDDVCELNRQFCYGYVIARAALGASHDADA